MALESARSDYQSVKSTTNVPESAADTEEDNANVERNPLIDGEGEIGPDASVETRELDKAGEATTTRTLSRARTLRHQSGIKTLLPSRSSMML